MLTFFANGINDATARPIDAGIRGASVPLLKDNIQDTRTMGQEPGTGLCLCRYDHVTVTTTLRFRFRHRFSLGLYLRLRLGGGRGGSVPVATPDSAHT